MQEREKIIEVLLSQERVLTLLYDKTFPPRSQSVGFTGQLGGGTQFNTASTGNGGSLLRNARASQSAHKLGGLSNVDSMRRFNYLAVSHERGVEDDVEQLEREIENVLKKTASTTVVAKGGTAVGGKRERLLDAHIVNMTTTGNFQNR